MAQKGSPPPPTKKGNTMKYQIRRAILAIVNALIAIAGLALANTCIASITDAINAIPETGLIAGSSEEFGLNLAGLVAGGAVFGFFSCLAIALAIWSTRD